MHKEYKITVIVPVYNLEIELPKTIKSIQDQEHDNLEIIIVDDGSTDGSVNLIRSLADSDSRIVPVLKEHIGVSAARLEGCRHASGDYVGFVDGDDIIEADMYKTLLDNALKHNADISHCGFQMVFPDGRVHYFYNSRRIVFQNTEKGVKDLLEGSFIEPTLCTKLYKKELIDRLLSACAMDKNIRVNEDLLMNFFLFSYAEDSVFYDICKYHYLIRNNSSSHQSINANRINDPIKVKEIILENVPDSLRKTAECALINTCLNIYHTLILSGGDYREQKVEILRKIRNHKAAFSSLSGKRHMMVGLCSSMPRLYAVLYKLYSKTNRKSKYE